MAQHVHELIAQTAYEMAMAVYEEVAKNNEFYKHSKANGLTQEEFAKKFQGNYIEEARKVLAEMLKLNSVPESEKELISEALIADYNLVRGRQGGTRRMV